MRKFKNLNEISKLSLKDLLLYKKELRNTLNEIEHEQNELKTTVQNIVCELKYKYSEIERHLKRTEEIRLDATTPAELAYLILH